MFKLILCTWPSVLRVSHLQLSPKFNKTLPGFKNHEWTFSKSSKQVQLKSTWPSAPWMSHLQAPLPVESHHYWMSLILLSDPSLSWPIVFYLMCSTICIRTRTNNFPMNIRNRCSTIFQREHFNKCVICARLFLKMNSSPKPHRTWHFYHHSQ